MVFAEWIAALDKVIAACHLTLKGNKGCDPDTQALIAILNDYLDYAKSPARTKAIRERIAVYQHLRDPLRQADAGLLVPLAGYAELCNREIDKTEEITNSLTPIGEPSLEFCLNYFCDLRFNDCLQECYDKQRQLYVARFNPEPPDEIRDILYKTHLPLIDRTHAITSDYFTELLELKLGD